MKKTLLLLIVILFSMNLFGSSYSVISECSPWGIVPVWKGSSSIEHDYSTKLDSCVSLGISWIRPNCLPHGGSGQIQDRNGLFNEYYLSEVDSFICYMNRHDLDLFTLYPGWPLWNYYSTYGQNDSSRIYWYYKTLVEMYDGDGIEAIDSCAYPPRTYRERRGPNNEPLIILYWEICNEPAWHAEWWPGYEGSWTISAFQKYIRIASKGIHAANSNAKVVGPAVEPIQSEWDTIRGAQNDTLPPYHFIYMPYDSFWLLMLTDTTDTSSLCSFDYLDVISFHCAFSHGETHDSDFIWIDQMLNVWDTLGYSHLRDKQIWITEGGWREDTHLNRAIEYKVYCESLLQNIDIVSKKFFFSLKWDDFHLLYQDWSHVTDSAFDTLQVFIKRNTPHINLIYPDSNVLVFSGNNYEITFDQVYDSFDSCGVHQTDPTDIKVRIELSTDDGKHWIVLDDSVEVFEDGSGSYSWLVDHITSETCKLRVIAVDPYRLEGTSTSDGYFSIRTCSWPLSSSRHPFDWDAGYGMGTFDECDYIIEKEDNNFLLSVKINQDSTGLVTYNPVERTFNNEVVFAKTTFSWIHCILEEFEPNMYILAGKYIDLLGNVNRAIRILNYQYNIICSSTPGFGEFYRVIKDISGEGYITVGWEVVNGVDRIKIQRFVFHYEEEPFIRWDNNFANSFNNSQLPGRFYSVIKTEDNNYVAVGHKGRNNGGACCFKFNSSGELIDSVSFGYISDKWTCFYDVKEDTLYPGYVMVGQCENYEGGIIVKVDSSGDSIWGQRYYDKELEMCRMYSVILNDNGDIIVAGTGNDPLLENKIGLILQFEPFTGVLVDITAPLSRLYGYNWDRSMLRALFKTSDGGFITGGYICNNHQSPWLKKIAICKLGYNEPDIEYSKHFDSNITTNFSIVCVSSLFRDKSTIRFVLPRQCNVNIDVYNILGQRVRTLVNEEREPGAYEIFWDGTDNRGVSVSSGSYFLRFQAGDFLTTKSLTVIR